jgi:hypothetical protein
VLPPVQEGAQGRQQPEERVGKVDPDGILHALDVTIAFGILVDVHPSKDTEDGDPEDEKDEIPDWREHACNAQDERNQVKDTCDCRYAAYDNRIDL